MTLLEAFGLNQHIKHVGENQERDDKQEEDHSGMVLDFLEPVDSLVEYSEAQKSRNEKKQGSTHMRWLIC